MRILYITDYVPYPPISGDRIRVYNLVRRLAKNHQVVLACFMQTADQIVGVSHMREFCYRVVSTSLPRRNKLARLFGVASYVLAGIPFDIEFLHSKDLGTKIAHLFETLEFDIVHVEQSRMAPYLEFLPSNEHLIRILAFQNIAFNQYESISNVESSKVKQIRAFLQSHMMRQWEPRCAERFDRCITVSEADRKILLEINPYLSVDVVPNGVDTKKHLPLKANQESLNLLFIGTMSYAPCVDAAQFFCREVFPLIEREVPAVHVWIVGANPSPEIMRLADDNIHVSGYVEDVLPYYRQAAVSVVPLRAGGGTRLKILESMALGRPVISTSIGCEGLNVEHGTHLLIADDPQQLAEETVHLLRDKNLYDHIVRKARQLVVEKYDWDEIAKQLNHIYTEVAS